MWPILPSLLVAFALPPTDPCPQGMVSHVFVDNHSVFDAPSLPEDPRVRWVYRTANRIHVRTRPSFIRNEILLRPGDCYNPQLASESARILRSFQFIADADAFSVEQPDGTHHLVVETRDEWTTKTSADVSFRDGLRLTELSVVEENLLGRGLTVGVFAREDEVISERGALIKAPRIGRRNWDLDLSLAKTRVGTSWEQAWIHPFIGEVGTLAIRQRAHRTTGEFAWTLPSNSQETHLVVPMESGGGEVVMARRVGGAGAFWVWGGGWSREWIRPGMTASVEAVRARDFATRHPAPSGLAEGLAGELKSLDVDRAHLLGGFRRIHHIARRRLDALDGLQDVALGGELLISVAPTLVVREGDHDRLFRGELFTGHQRGAWIAQTRTMVEARNLTREAADTGQMKDVLGAAYLLLYYTPEDTRRTRVVRLAGEGGWRMSQPFQLTLGGPAGVRGFDLRDYPGAKRVVMTVEERFRFDSPFPQVFDLGGTLFADGGRIFPGGRAWEQDSGWQGSVGLGLRLGFPAGSASVIRLDLAFPLEGGGARPTLSIHAREWIGLDDALRRMDLDRSRWHGVGLRFPGVAQRGPSL